jgi:hypothetical protein
MSRSFRARAPWVRASLSLFSFVPLVLIASAAPAASKGAAEDDIAALKAELAALRSSYEARLAALEERIAAISATSVSNTAESAAPTPPEAGSAVAAPSVASAATGANPANYFNPAISVIGNFLAAGGGDSELASADLRESEVGLQAIVDPYTRADVFLAAGEEGIEVEEGYLTFTALPRGFLAKVGRFRTPFGAINTLHLHTLPWPDRPLPVERLLGGEEGWIGTGVSVSRLMPLGNTFSEITVGAQRGEAEGLFEAIDRSDLAWHARYRLFRDIGDSSNVDVGFSYGLGPNGVAEGSDTALSGLDVTYRWKPLERGLYRGLVLRGEAYRSEREQEDGTVDALGWFVSGDYRFARRWSAGARYERSEHADDATLVDRGRALLLTFSPSEFLQFRGELRRREFADGVSADDFLLQMQFAIGAHSAHPF